MIYTPRYYLRLVEQYGLKKIKKFYVYDMDISEDSGIGRLERVVATAAAKLEEWLCRKVRLKKI